MTARPPVWVTELAARFWADVGDPPPFPRDLRGVLCWLQGVHVVDVPHLTLATATEHFTRHGVPCPRGAQDRPLAGCFGAHCGVGVILFDPTLEPAEVRFTLAHETAHFLRDYDRPRRKAVSRLGPRSLEVLDGLRSATANERLAGLLRDVRLGPQTHFLDRDRWGRTVSAEAGEAEIAADRLAFELLAPFDAVKSCSSALPVLTDRLISEFGLPAQKALGYAAILNR